MSTDIYPSTTAGNSAGRCTEYAYDPAYSQLRTTVSVDIGDCGSATKVATQYMYDRVLGTTLSTIAPGSEQTTMTYDAFARPLTVAKPDPTTPLMSDAPSTTITYSDTTYGQLVHTNQTGGSSGSGTNLSYAPMDTYAYLDAFGRTIQVVSTSDAAGQWVLSGQVMRDARGRPIASFAPSFITASAGGAVPIAPPAAPSTSTTYDAFNRTTQTNDIDGTILAVKA